MMRLSILLCLITFLLSEISTEIIGPFASTSPDNTATGNGQYSTTGNGFEDNNAGHDGRYHDPLLQRHVLLVGMDGCTSEGLESVLKSLKESKELPHFRRIFYGGVFDFDIFSGGQRGTETEQPTMSEPSWTTILTGVYTDRHNIWTKEDLEHGKLDSSVPTLFNYLHTHIPRSYTAALFDYQPLLNLIGHEPNGTRGPSLLYSRPSHRDLGVSMKKIVHLTDYAMHIMKHRDPTLLFIYFKAIDEAGHLGGFSSVNPLYQKAIRSVAEGVERLLKEIQEKRRHGQQWLVALVSDHGGIGTNHGGQSELERKVFFVLHDPVDRLFQEKNRIRSERGLGSLTPTVLKYLLGAKYDAVHFPLLNDPLDTSFKASGGGGGGEEEEVVEVDVENVGGSGDKSLEDKNLDKSSEDPGKPLEPPPTVEVYSDSISEPGLKVKKSKSFLKSDETESADGYLKLNELDFDDDANDNPDKSQVLPHTAVKPVVIELYDNTFDDSNVDSSQPSLLYSRTCFSVCFLLCTLRTVLF